jgi:CBS domain-containing protein
MTTARDIMNAGATCIGEDQTLMQAAQMMRDMNVGSLPICGNDKKLHGIITDRDIVISVWPTARTPTPAPPASSRRVTSPGSTPTPR